MRWPPVGRFSLVDLEAAAARLRADHEQRVERVSRALVSAQLAATAPLPASIAAVVAALAAMSPREAALAVALVRAVPAAPSSLTTSEN